MACAYGGFAELGLPLSRCFNANQKGYNAGWQLYLHAGKDQLVHRDAAMQLGLHAGLQATGNGLALLMSFVLDGSGGQNRVKQKLLWDFAVMLNTV
jgi:hypothetical protein